MAFRVLQSIDEINSYYDIKSGSFKEYVSDLKTKRAIERNIEIIGEAINRIIKKDKNLKIENAQKIIGTRNRIIHGYDKISNDLIWSIFISHLQKLKKEIKKLLKQ